MALTPMMQQYFEIKDKYRDHILFYRLGDFYEMFFEDATLASQELEITLTARDCGEGNRAPMCGVPFHSYEQYMGRLIEKGYKVAICEQVEDPALAKGIVKREVVRVITPGTLIESDLLVDAKNNYLCAVYIDGGDLSVAFSDITTPKISCTHFSGDEALSSLMNEISTYSPSEVILNLSYDKCMSLYEFLKDHMGVSVSDGAEYLYDETVCTDYCRSHFPDTAMYSGEMLAVGALIGYIVETQKKDVSYIKELEVYFANQFLGIDINTRRNLELCETMRTKEKKGTLLWVLDKTKTAPGARMLRNWIEHPLVNVSQILRRQGAVTELFDSFMMREELSELLSGVLDLERLTTKIIYGTANGRDLRSVHSTISVIPQVKELLRDAKNAELSEIRDGLDEMSDLRDLIGASIHETPPFLIREGGMIADGYNSDVDYLRSVMKDGKSWITRIEQQEKDLTGIKNLKVGYNKVFGYYIEVSRSNVDLVPERYIRKQTLTNGERYITDELKDMEATILGAKDKLYSLEYELFCGIRDKLSENSKRLLSAASILAKLDSYLSLATVASRNRYVCPEVDASDVIDIREGRHPVVEQYIKDSYFVPNDTYLDTSSNRLMLITGPNMAGKSTYMRQVALITVMAQIGSFVPADDARIGVVDKIFTRVGASDDLASGQSTFMLEMNEVAHILKNATSKSLIIYDEIGRGTSTYDGLSIARAVAEYSLGKKIGAKTLFATHYHELVSLETDVKGAVNYNIAAKKKGDDIIFLRKIIRGSTDDSYGIEVAKLAGVPNEVIKRAKEVLSVIERSVPDVNVAKNSAAAEQETYAVTLTDISNESIINQLKSVDVNTLTPIEAMNLIYELKKQII